MNMWELPSALVVGGNFFEIRTDYRVVLKIIGFFSDPNYEADEQAVIALRILYKDWKSIPESLYLEAVQAAYQFIDMGATPQNNTSPRLMDWEQDAALIIPAINKVLGFDVRGISHLHWWTFIAAYREIGESLYTTVLHLRQKRAKNVPLEKHERRFLNENQELVSLKTKYSEEDKAAFAEWGIFVD